MNFLKSVSITQSYMQEGWLSHMPCVTYWKINIKNNSVIV